MALTGPSTQKAHMSFTITPTRCEIWGEELEAVIEMQDKYASSVTIKALQSPASWRELAEAVQCALETMHPESAK